MIPFALILLATSTRLELVNEALTIPAGDWRYVELGLNQKPALVSAAFEVESGAQRLTLRIMRRPDMDRLRKGLPNGAIVATLPGNKGRLLYRVSVPGDYVVVIDNRSGDRQPSVARLRVALDFGANQRSQVTRLSPQRQLTVILISFAVFFTIVTYSARRLLRGIRH